MVREVKWSVVVGDTRHSLVLDAQALTALRGVTPESLAGLLSGMFPTLSTAAVAALGAVVLEYLHKA